MRPLGEWPRLVVGGQPVTEEQANEILVRTDNWWLTSNDPAWEMVVAREAGIKADSRGRTDYQDAKRFRAENGVLDLSYMMNSRIVSAWIGGPHGWCDWYGTIGTSSYNIGKWPEVEEVADDWRQIAEAWPFLDLTAQLIGGEGEAALPFVEYRVLNGTVTVIEDPAALLTPPKDLPDEQVITRFVRPDGERGVSLERLRRALNQVKRGRIVPELTAQKPWLLEENDNANP